MRAVLQRVASASGTVESEAIGASGRGWLVLLGVGQGDGDAEVELMVERVQHLRAFPDESGKMNLSVRDIGGSLLVVSQFTLYGDCRKGRRPGFSAAAAPEAANALYEKFVAQSRAAGLVVATGRFQTHMDVALVNDGPVTLLLDSSKTF